MHHAYILYGEDVSLAEETALKIANFFENGVPEMPKNILCESLLMRPINGRVGIDEARKIRHFLATRPVHSLYKVVIVSGAEHLTAEAQNALLKIMEEPPDYAQIFLITPQKEHIISTVRSRAHAVRFPLRDDSNKASPLRRAPLLKFDIASLEKLISEGADNDEELNRVLYSLLDTLRARPTDNFPALCETVRRITILKQSNANKRLQLKVIRNTILGLKHNI